MHFNFSGLVITLSPLKLTVHKVFSSEMHAKEKEFFEVKSESQGILDIWYSYIQNKGDSAFRLTIPVKILS